jgi:hypothetical protein
MELRLRHTAYGTGLGIAMSRDDKGWKVSVQTSLIPAAFLPPPQHSGLNYSCFVLRACSHMLFLPTTGLRWELAERRRAQRFAPFLQVQSPP